MIVPVYFELSVPPQVSSPFRTSSDVVGWKEIPIVLAEIDPALDKLSVTVGMEVLVPGDRVPTGTLSGGFLLSKRIFWRTNGEINRTNAKDTIAIIKSRGLAKDIN